MTLSDINKTLPNGFRDAQILQATVDYEQMLLRLTTDILVALPGAPEDAISYRRGVVTFHGLRTFVVEAPKPGSAFIHPGCLWLGPVERAMRSSVGFRLLALLHRVWAASTVFASRQRRRGNRS
jgi:hypothetical protein